MITFHDEKNITIPDIPSRKYSCIEKDNDDYGLPFLMMKIDY